MHLKEFVLFIMISVIAVGCTGQVAEKPIENKISIEEKEALPIQVAANLTEKYLPLLENKKIGIVGNHSSMISNTHLVDSLLSLNIDIVKVFSPEHGFRGKADAGEKVQSDIDSKTELPIISLYGKNKKPTNDQVQGLDVVVFDIQDVGARFYTYISTMHYVMETCAENNIQLIVLDRPNPNGHYVDGPILDTNFKSFIGMHPVPIVHGMTVGEYAKMINGEGWLKDKVQCNLTIIEMENYDHNSTYNLPIKPSPNLPNMKSVYLYPSLCLFEGTPVSIGRGTEKPFQIIGHPKMDSLNFSFTPTPTEGAKNPKLKNELCYGLDLSTVSEMDLKKNDFLDLSYLVEAYNQLKEEGEFFKSSFNLLTGGDTMQQQLKDGLSEDEIKASWEEGLKEFKVIRKKYLLYQDFE